MSFEPISVPVTGGHLNVGTQMGREGAPVLVMIHGITANHLTWAMVADELADDVTILAPDLRGRAGSARVPGPYGMVNHANDIRAILDHVGVDTAVIVGHSMGAFVAAAFAANHADRMAGLVLIDGGVSFATLPEGADIDAVLTEILGPTMQRLSMTFPDVHAWIEFWKAHPSLQEWNRAIEAYVMADLVGETPNLQSSCTVDAIRADGADTLGDGGQFFRQLARPTPWLRAPRGLLNQVPPLYPDELAATICAEYPALRDHLIADVNHFTITLSKAGAVATAAIIRSQLP